MRYNWDMRIDVYLVGCGLAKSRAKAQELIESGLVFVDGKIISKASTIVTGEEKIEVKTHDEYVSRGAYKLLGAIDKFALDFGGRVVLDMGASTGGFTQVALNHGAKKVYAVDVGKGQLDKLLREDKRVVSIEEMDVRAIDAKELSDVDFIIGDLSFISLKKVLPHIKNEFGDKEMCLLFKPQFECGQALAKKCRGVIKDEKVHLRLLKDFCEFIKVLGFSLSGLAVSPIKGGDGNREYLVYLNGKGEAEDIEKVVKDAFSL